MEKRGSKKEREERRFRGIAMLKEGRRGSAVAEILGVTPGAVSQWKAAYEERGEKGLRSKPHAGGQFKLTPKRRKKLPKILLAGAQAYGFETRLWTLERVAKVIEREFGVTYHPAHVWKILHAMGWSCQKPERRARERDDKAIEEWHGQEWPRIKGGLAGKAGASFS